MYVVAQNRLPQWDQTLSEAAFEFLINIIYITEMPRNTCEKFADQMLEMCIFKFE